MRQFNNRIFFFSMLMFCMASFLGLTNANAQDSLSAQESKVEKKWNFLVEPYIMFPYMTGDLGLRVLPTANVDASPGDIFSKLQFGAMLYMEANTDRWAITSDLLYMSLSQDVTPTTIIESGKADAKQTAWEFAGLYRVSPGFEIGLGGRLNNVQSELTIDRNELGDEVIPLSGDISKTWFDPFVVMRVQGDFGEKWLYTFRADAGGAGVGSTFSGQIQAYLGYQFSPLFHLKAGYKLLYMDYESGSGTDYFGYNMKIYGPTINFGFNF